MSPVLRARLTYLAFAVATIALGLGVFRGALPLRADLRDKVGDALWAAMMLWLVSACMPYARLVVRAGVAFGLCVLVECSQLYHTPGLDALRATRLGHLVLGSGFDARDLAAYACGVLAAALAERIARARATVVL